jgi:hypothetical protein
MSDICHGHVGRFGLVLVKSSGTSVATKEGSIVESGLLLSSQQLVALDGVGPQSDKIPRQLDKNVVSAHRICRDEHCKLIIFLVLGESRADEE